MLKKDTAKYIEALKRGLAQWRDCEEHRNKSVEGSNDAICDFMRTERDRLHKHPCQCCFLHKKELCDDSLEVSTRPYWLMVFGDEQSPLYERLPDDEGRADMRRKDMCGLHYPVFRGVMRRVIEGELRRVSGTGRASPFYEEAVRP
jgi:hypothetical protein